MEDTEPEDFDLLDFSELCFYCSEQLTVPCVMWQGETGQLYFHPAWAAKPGGKLIRDGEEAQQLPEDM